MLKRIAKISLVLILCTVIFAGCSNKAPDEPSETVSQGAASQTVSPSAEPGSETSYAAQGAKILKGGNAIYDAAEYENSDTAGIDNLIIGGDALYFTEFSGTYKDDAPNETTYSIIRTEKDGKGRKVLASMSGANGYSSLLEFKENLVYIEDGYDSVSIGSISKDGSNGKQLDISAYAAQYDIEPFLSYADLSVEGDLLYAEVGVFLQDGTTDVHFLKIDQDFNIERIPPKNDMYTSDGSKIYKLPANTFEKITLYDASDYYEEDTVWVSYLQYDDNALYFTEEGTPKGQAENKDFIVRIDKNGGSRQELYTSAYNEDIQLCAFKDKLFYVTQWDDYIQIRYMDKNGEGDSPLDLSAYAQQEGLDQEYQNASLYTDGDYIYVQVKFGSQDGKSYEMLNFKIDEHLNIELAGASQ